MEGQNGHTQRRSDNRISTSMDVRYFYGNMFYSGIITNVSESGVFLRSKMCLPSGSMCVLLFQSENRILHTTARITRAGGKGTRSDGMGMKIVNPSLEYLKFVRSKKSLYQ